MFTKGPISAGNQCRDAVLTTAFFLDAGPVAFSGRARNREAREGPGVSSKLNSGHIVVRLARDLDLN
jgi:hypothetical protein